MKVYELPVQRHDIFLFYKREEKWTRVTDPEHPAPSNATMWNPIDKFLPRKYPMDGADRLIIPSVCRLLPEDFDAFLKEHVIAQFKILDREQVENYNIFIVYKHLADRTIEVGLFAKEGHADIVNEKFSKMIEQQLKLKIFW